jgi:hypothetical protein
VKRERKRGWPQNLKGAGGDLREMGQVAIQEAVAMLFRSLEAVDTL